MKSTILALLLSTVALADSSPLTNVVLFEGLDHDAFAVCAARAAVTQVLGKMPAYDGYSLKFPTSASLSDSQFPSMTAEISAIIAKGSDNRLVTVKLQSLDNERGWLVEQDTARGLYYFSTSVSTTVELFAANADLGSADISGCR
jgi:hypothetical protein